jgi:colicin import membrane protein
MGQVTHVANELGEIRQREFRRMLVVSVTGHCLLFFFLIFRPGPASVMLPGVVSVELVAAPAAPAPAKPARPAAPPKPVPKKVVLPKEPTAPKPKAVKVEKKAPPPEPTPEPEVVEQEYSDVIDQLRAAAGESAEQPEESAAAPAAMGSGGGIGVQVSPEVAAWIKQAKIHVRRAWVLPPAFRTQALEAHVLVRLDAGGNVIGIPDVVRRSGNPWFDEGVVRAIQKSSPLPPPPAADEWSFVFVPGDSY